MSTVELEVKVMTRREFSQNMRWLNYWVRKANEYTRKASSLNDINFELSPGPEFAHNRINAELLRLDAEKAHKRACEFAERLDGVAIYITGVLTVTEQKWGGGTPGVIGSARWYEETHTFEVIRSPRILRVKIGKSRLFGYEITFWVHYNGHPAHFNLYGRSKTVIVPRIPQPTS